MAERGRAAVLVDDYRFEIRELPAPEVEPEGILVKVTGCGVCGSDLHLWRGDLRMPGCIHGHELVGRVHSMGARVSTDCLERPLKEGDRVIFSYFTPATAATTASAASSPTASTTSRSSVRWRSGPYCHGGFADYWYVRPGASSFASTPTCRTTP